MPVPKPIWDAILIFLKPECNRFIDIVDFLIEFMATNVCFNKL